MSLDETIRESLEGILDADADSIDAAVLLAKAELLDDVDLHHLSAIQVARGILQIYRARPGDALVILSLLAYPCDTQGAIAARMNISARTIKRVLAQWRGRFVWIDNMADLRAAVAPRRRKAGGGIAGPFDGGRGAGGGPGSV